MRLKVTFMDILAIVGVMLGIVAVAPMLVWWLYSPMAGFRVGGEELGGDGIAVPMAGRVPLAVFTDSKRRLEIENLRISYDPENVDLAKTKGAHTLITTDRRYPVALRFAGPRELVAGHLQGAYFDYMAKRPAFRVKLTTTLRARQEELPYWARVFGSNSRTVERIVEFTASKGAAWTLPESGLRLEPGESLEVEGVQSQEGASCATKKGTAYGRVIEILKDDIGSQPPNPDPR
jgi:hypothetical protein